MTKPLPKYEVRSEVYLSDGVYGSEVDIIGTLKQCRRYLWTRAIDDIASGYCASFEVFPAGAFDEGGDDYEEPQPIFSIWRDGHGFMAQGPEEWM